TTATSNCWAHFAPAGGQGLAEKQAFIAKRWLADQRSGVSSAVIHTCLGQAIGCHDNQYRTALLKSHAAEGSPAGQIFPAGSHRALVGQQRRRLAKKHTSE
uniref:Transposase n=1 Tax=Macrostomum lignano TaxID=282301 RepID=A0A1I8IUI9_9PLAT